MMLAQVTTKKAIKNCLYLADFLESVPRKHYDQNNYYDHQGDHAQRKANPLDCKTKACALGHAACLPYFNRQGLKMISEGPNWSFDLNHDPNDITENLFGMDKDTTDDIFEGATTVTHKGTPKSVAKALRAHAETLQETL